MRKTMQQLTEEYAEKYLPNHDRMSCIDVHHLLDMARVQALKDECTQNVIYHAIVFSFRAGFMKGYHSAEYDRKKKAQKGNK